MLSSLESRRRNFVDRFDPEGLHLKQATRTAVAGGIALVLYNWLYGPQSVFMIWSSVFIIQVNTGLTLGHQLRTIALTGAFSLAGVGMAASLQHTPLMLSLFLVFPAFAMSLMMAYSYDAWNAALRVNLLTIMSAGIAAPSLFDIQARILHVASGTLLALVVCSLLWPPSLARLYSRSLSAALRTAHNLFALLLERLQAHDEVSIKATEEALTIMRATAGKILHRNELIAQEWLKRLPPEEEKARAIHQMARSMDQLFELLLSAGRFRLHLSSHPILTPFVSPMKQIEEQMGLLLDQLPKNREQIQKATLQMMAAVMEIQHSEPPSHLPLAEQEEYYLLRHNLLLLVKSCDAIGLLALKIGSANVEN